MDFYTAGQLRWFRPGGAPADAAYFDNPDNHAITWLINGVAFQDPAAAVYVAYNAWSSDVSFQLPPPRVGKKWSRAVDTSPWMESASNFALAGSEELLASAPCHWPSPGSAVRPPHHWWHGLSRYSAKDFRNSNAFAPLVPS